MTKNFLIVNDEHPNTLCEELKGKALQFVADKFGKDKLPKVWVHADGLDGGEFSIELTFMDYSYSEDGVDQNESLLIEFDDEGVQPFYENGRYFSKKVLRSVLGVPFCKKDRDVYGFAAMDVYEAFKDYMLTC